VIPLLVVGGLLAAGCSSSGEAQPKAQPTRSVAPPPPPSFAPGLQAATSTSYAVGIPTDPAFVPAEGETRSNGTVIKRWRFELSPGGPACTVVTSEQPSYDGDFPAAALETFRTLAEKTDHVVANESVPPPPGAVAAIRQELQFSAQLADGSTVPARLFQRQLLTPGRTLVQVTAAGPEDAVARCRAADIAASLQLTGAETTTS
jgi:hypothetical protein